MTMNTEREVVTPVELFDGGKHLNPEARDWARKPVFQFNSRGPLPLKKKWNEWSVISDSFALRVAVAHMGYAGAARIWFTDLENWDTYERIFMRPPGKGVDVPGDVAAGAFFRDRNHEIEMLKRTGGVSLKVNNFNARGVSTDIDVDIPGWQESINAVIAGARNHFLYTSCHLCLPAVGTIRALGKKYICDPHTTYAVLDHGRGVLPWSTDWKRAVGWGRRGDYLVGFNFFTGFDSYAGSTCNAALVNGGIHKIGDEVIFRSDYDGLLAQRSVRSAGSDSIDISFEPVFEDLSTRNVLLLSIETRRAFGHFTGRAELAGGAIEFSELSGWMEEHSARW